MDKKYLKSENGEVAVVNVTRHVKEGINEGKEGVSVLLNDGT